VKSEKWVCHKQIAMLPIRFPPFEGGRGDDGMLKFREEWVLRGELWGKKSEK